MVWMGDKRVENGWKDGCGGMRPMCGERGHELGVWGEGRMRCPFMRK
jgi:hypothetical protein